jgi:hypothetical protein
MNHRPTLYFLTALVLACSFGTLAAQTYPRTVLIEEFTSATCVPCSQATPIINSIIADSKYQSRVISVRYHMDLPFAGDPWYKANVPDNSARKAFYGISALPAARINGVITQVQPTNETDMRLAIEGEMNGAAGNAPAKLEVTQSQDGNQVSVAVKVTAGEAINGLKLMAAAVETRSHIDTLIGAPWNHEKDVYDVMRKLLPDANGQTVTLAAGKSQTFNLSYTIDPSWQADQMYTVAFLQDAFDNTVVQAGFSPRPTPSSVDAPASLTGFSLAPSAPNPASTVASIGYTLGSPEHVTIELRDLSGALVSRLDEGARESGSHQAGLDVSGLPSGVYSYTIRAGEYRESRMLTVVR